MSAANRVRAIIQAEDEMWNFLRAMEFGAIADDIDFANERAGFVVEPVNEPVVIESDPYLGDPVASLQDSDEDMAGFGRQLSPPLVPTGFTPNGVRLLGFHLNGWAPSSFINPTQGVTMYVIKTAKNGKSGNMVVTADGVKLFATYGVGSRRRAYDFIAAQR